MRENFEINFHQKEKCGKFFERHFFKKKINQVELNLNVLNSVSKSYKY